MANKKAQLFRSRRLRRFIVVCVRNGAAAKLHSGVRVQRASIVGAMAMVVYINSRSRLKNAPENFAKMTLQEK